MLFAQGPYEPAEIKALVEAVRPKPLNFLVVRDMGLSVEHLAVLGARHISIGGALASLEPYAQVSGLFSADLPSRRAHER